MDRIMQGQNWPEQGNFCPADAPDGGGGEESGVRSGYQQRSIVMLRKANPVKTKFIGQHSLLKHLLHHALSECWLKQAGRSRPARFIHGADAIRSRRQEGSFHADTLFHITGSQPTERPRALLACPDSLPSARRFGR